MLEGLKVKRYKGSNTAPYGPKESPLYYYNLSPIDIDYVRVLKKEKELGLEWTKVPKNPTYMKIKIIAPLLSMRKYNGDNKHFEIDQSRLLDMLKNAWGYA